MLALAFYQFFFSFHCFLLMYVSPKIHWQTLLEFVLSLQQLGQAGRPEGDFEVEYVAEYEYLLLNYFLYYVSFFIFFFWFFFCLRSGLTQKRTRRDTTQSEMQTEAHELGEERANPEKCV